MSSETTRDAADAMAAIRELVTGDAPFRIEFGTSFTGSGGQFASARFYEQRGTRWAKVGPVLLPPVEGGRKELIETLLHLWDAEVAR